MKFKPGDRVLLVKNYSYYPNVGLTGTIMECGENFIENMYKVKWDKGITDEGLDTFEGELQLITKLEKALK